MKRLLDADATTKQLRQILNRVSEANMVPLFTQLREAALPAFAKDALTFTECYAQILTKLCIKCQTQDSHSQASLQNAILSVNTAYLVALRRVIALDCGKIPGDWFFAEVVRSIVLLF